MWSPYFHLGYDSGLAGLPSAAEPEWNPQQRAHYYQGRIAGLSLLRHQQAIARGGRKRIA